MDRPQKWLWRMSTRSIRPNHILAKVFDGVRALRRARQAVAGAVVAQDVEMLAQRLDLPVPHRQVGTQRVVEGQPRSIGTAVDAVVQTDAVLP